MRMLLIVFMASLIAATAEATPSQTTLQMHASQRDVGHTHLLRLQIRTSMNDFPAGPCLVTVYGGLSTVGKTSPLPVRFRAVTRRQTIRRVNKFYFLGNPVNGTSTSQTQLNVYATVSCPDDFVEMETNYDASNITCVGGVSRKVFKSQLRRHLR